jgi:cytochrome bd-type quinol oxidase subunit 2
LAETSGSEPVAAGPGRLLVAVYGIFAVAASSRAGLQLLTRFDDAPVAYLLSALAAGVYVVATVALARSVRRLALWACGFELVGVLVVGALSLLLPDAFPDQTVWSSFGAGYGFIPLVLPVLGLLRLRRTA